MVIIVQRTITKEASDCDEREQNLLVAERRKNLVGKQSGHRDRYELLLRV